MFNQLIFALKILCFLSRVEIIPSVMLEGESSAPSTASGTRRKVFAKSKSVKTCYSMPAPVRS